MRVYKGKNFARFARRSGLADEQLCAAIADMERGRIDADLGGQVYKQRIARQGKGKSGGFRTILLIRWEALAIFVHGFAKSDKDNISFAEVAVYRTIARNLLYEEAMLQRAMDEGKLLEVHCRAEILSQ